MLILSQKILAMFLKDLTEFLQIELCKNSKQAPMVRGHSAEENPVLT